MRKSIDAHEKANEGFVARFKVVMPELEALRKANVEFSDRQKKDNNTALS